MAKNAEASRPRLQRGEVQLRIISGVILIGAVLAVAYFGGWVLFAAVVACLGIGLYELSQVLAARGVRPFYLGGLVLGLAFLVDAQLGTHLIWPALLLAVIVTVLAPRFTPYTYRDLIDTGLAGVYLGFLLSFALLIRMLPNGYAWFLLVLLGVGSADVFAYFIGTWLGKTPLAPRISPHKTWEGLAGGGVGCLLVLAVMNALLHDPLAWWGVLALGLLLTACDILGDLAASIIKRAAGVKNYGRLIPGHGGLLDRIDGVLFALPFAYLLIALVLI